ncbi:MAG: DUF4350 domain-containing protein [Candidatus Eremiobacteraeota bacterium]|nr:DUF4350 domain-containing protein [Candidatus Eremiobacteraeota bacterium]
MKSRWRSWPWLETLLTLSALVALGLLARLHASNQQAAAYVDTHSSYDVRSGGYAAWYEMLRREGVRVERFERRPAYLDAATDALILAPPAAAPGDLRAASAWGYEPVDYAALAGWVSRGGRLIFVSDHTAAAPALRLPHTVRSARAKDAAVRVFWTPLAARVSHVAGRGDARIALGATGAAVPVLGDAAGAVMVQYRLGRGRVIALTDPTLFTNGEVGKADNARLAYDIAAVGPRGVTAFEEWSHGHAAGDSLWGILPPPMRSGLSIAALALGLVLVGTGWRFGPATKLHENVDRTSFEYLDSMATLLARGRAGRIAIGDLVGAQITAAARDVGLPATASFQTLVERVARGPDGLGRAAALADLHRLAAYAHPTDDEVVRAARIALSLRKGYRKDEPIRVGRRPTAAYRTR